MSAPDWVIIGTVTAPHGVHGEVRVKIETDFPERFTEAERLTFLEAPSSPDRSRRDPRSTERGERGAPQAGSRSEVAPPREIDVEDARPHKGMMLLKLAGHDDREAAEKLRGALVVVPRQAVRPLPEGTWYVFDLEGLEVFTRDGVRLGILTEVLHPGANDVYVVRDGGRETLLPAIKQVILDVDLTRRRMTVEPLEEYEETP